MLLLTLSYDMQPWRKDVATDSFETVGFLERGFNRVGLASGHAGAIFELHQMPSFGNTLVTAVGNLLASEVWYFVGVFEGSTRCNLDGKGRATTDVRKSEALFPEGCIPLFYSLGRCGAGRRGRPFRICALTSAGPEIRTASAGGGSLIYCLAVSFCEVLQGGGGGCESRSSSTTCG